MAQNQRSENGSKAIDIGTRNKKAADSKARAAWAGREVLRVEDMSVINKQQNRKVKWG